MHPAVRKAILTLTAGAAVLAATGCAAERIDPNDFDQVAPSFNGETVVWEDSRNAERRKRATPTRSAGCAGAG